MVVTITRVTDNSENVVLVEQARPDRGHHHQPARGQKRRQRRGQPGLADAMDRLDGDAGLSVGVLTGAGGSFCAGMDLKAFAAGKTSWSRAAAWDSPNDRRSSR